MLSTMLAAGLIIGNMVVQKIRTAGFLKSSITALGAADGAVEWCLFEARSESAIAVPTFQDGATYQIIRTSDSSDISDDCTIFGSDPILFRAIGNYRGVSRALEITE